MLMEHNKETYEQFKAMLLEHHECCLVAATGGGKTYITLQFIKDFNLRALIICPRNTICNEWINTASKHGISVQSITYQMFHQNTDIFIEGYDIYIFDEAHHIGSKKWGQTIRDFRSSLDDDIMVAGLTANPNRYELHIIRQIVDVSVSEFDGHVVYGSDMKDAIRRGIFLPATYIYALFDTEGLRRKYHGINGITTELKGKLDLTIRNAMKIDEILRKHTSKLKNIKGIVFVEDIASIDEGKDIMHKAFPDLDIFILHSKLSKNQKESTMEKFKKAISGLIVCVDMISEGVHIPGVNTIIMLRKTSSPNLYNQQLGRGFSSTSKENTIIFDFVGNAHSIKYILSLYTNASTIKKKVYDDHDKYEEIISDQNIIYDYTTSINDVLEEIESILSKRWSDDEVDILREFYPTMGGSVSEMLEKRTSRQCVAMANRLNISYVPREWTDDEDSIIKEYYPKIGTDVIAMLHNRSRRLVRKHANEMGIVYNRTYKWTQSEIDILTDNYPHMGSKVSELLPGVKIHTIINKANSLGIRYIGSAYSDEEIQILKDNYGIKSIKELSKLLGRSEKSVSGKIHNLRLASSRRWTKEEDDIIMINYYKMGTSVAKLLPGRSRVACGQRAQHLGLKASSKIYKVWTKDQDQILIDNYHKMGSNVFTLIPGMTKDDCIYRARKLSLKTMKNPPKPWTDEEVAILVENYDSLGSGVSKLLAGRSVSSCGSKAFKIFGGRKSIKNCVPRVNWTDEEDKILKDNYPLLGVEAFKLLPNRTEASCKDRCYTLGLKIESRSAFKRNSLKWTSEEDDILRVNYNSIRCDADVEKILPGRTYMACKGRAKQLNISKTPSIWTQEEDDVIRNNYTKAGAKKIMHLLPGRTERAIRKRANDLGLNAGRSYSVEEDNIIISYYPSIGTEVVSMLPGRTKAGIVKRAQLLGVQRVQKKK